jgi:hypothetical protein
LGSDQVIVCVCVCVCVCERERERERERESIVPGRPSDLCAGVDVFYIFDLLLRVWGFRVWGLGGMWFGVWGLGDGIWGMEFRFSGSKPETRNPKPETRNPKPETLGEECGGIVQRRQVGIRVWGFGIRVRVRVLGIRDSD